MRRLGPRPAHTRDVVPFGCESSLGSWQRLAGLQEGDVRAQEPEEGGAWGLAGDGASLLPALTQLTRWAGTATCGG